MTPHGQITARLAILAMAACLGTLIDWGKNARAADNELTAEEKSVGWLLLFDGHDLSDWKNNNGQPLPENVVQDGAVNPRGAGGYLVIFDQEFGDFVFKCDVKMSQPECNSGVFFRVSDLSDPIFTGFEVQVFAGTAEPVHRFGAVYDLVGPSKDATKGAGEWDHLEIRCEGPLVKVSVNGELVAQMNCDDFDRPGLRPDGSRHKFRRAIKDFARQGYIGLQDHGSDVWYKNIKLLEL